MFPKLIYVIHIKIKQNIRQTNIARYSNLREWIPYRKETEAPYLTSDSLIFQRKVNMKINSEFKN